MPPFRPVGVVFDLDGLLVDSEPAWDDAERRVVLAYGMPWDPAVHTLLLGRGPADAAHVLAEYLGVDDEREVSRRLLQAAVAEFRQGIPVRPGARELVEALSSRLPLAVATNSRRVLAELALDSAGLASLVEVVICAEDVAGAKPAPDPYLAACRALGVDPARCVGFEDSPVGVASAKAAGLWVVGCPSLESTILDADAIIGNLAEINPSGLL